MFFRIKFNGLFCEKKLIIALSFLLFFVIIIFVWPDWNKELFRAVETKNLSLVKKAIKKGAKINYQDPDDLKKTVLHNAAYYGYIKIIKYLLEKKADVSVEDVRKCTPLDEAVKNVDYYDNKIEAARLLLDFGADVNHPNKYGQTALFIAAEESHPENLRMVKLLISRGADINAVDMHGVTPFMRAYSEKDRLAKPGYYHDQDKRKKIFPQLVRLLWKSPHKDLLAAAKQGDFHAVRETLDKGAAIEVRDRYGYTPLSNAAVNGHINIVRYLLEKGDEVEPVQKIGISPLSRAVREGHFQVIKLLVASGADVNREDELNKTVLVRVIYSKTRHAVAVFSFLVKEGADVNKGNSYGQTPLMSAALGDKTKFMRLLIKNGALIDKRDNFGSTALMLACEYGAFEAVKLLLHHGADADLQDKRGNTALDYAKMKGHKKISSLFMK